MATNTITSKKLIKVKQHKENQGSQILNRLKQKAYQMPDMSSRVFPKDLADFNVSEQEAIELLDAYIYSRLGEVTMLPSLTKNTFVDMPNGEAYEIEAQDPLGREVYIMLHDFNNFLLGKR